MRCLFAIFRCEAGKPRPDGDPEELRTPGDHLRRRRLDLGLLQRDVAEELGVNETSIHNWENNRSSPALRLLPRTLAFLGYDPYDEPSEMLGEHIMAFRRALGLTQKELAHHLGIDPSTLGRWERGNGRLSRRCRERLLVFLADQAPGPIKPQRRSDPREDE